MKTQTVQIVFNTPFNGYPVFTFDAARDGDGYSYSAREVVADGKPERDHTGACDDFIAYLEASYGSDITSIDLLPESA